MIARKILVALLVVAAIPTASAFKATRRRTVAFGNNQDVMTGEPLDINSSIDEKGDALLVRGGQEDGGIAKSDVVKYHGMTSVFFGACIMLETLGLEIPLIGPTAIIPGFDSGNGALKYVTRFYALILSTLGLMEIEFADSPAMKDLFTKYHVAAALIMLLTTNEIGGEGMNYLYAAIVSLFAIGGLIGK